MRSLWPENLNSWYQLSLSSMLAVSKYSAMRLVPSSSSRLTVSNVRQAVVERKSAQPSSWSMNSVRPSNVRDSSLPITSL